MSTESSRSHVSAPNYHPEPISDYDLIRGFELSLGASGRRDKTLEVYTDSIKALSTFTRQEGLPPLAVMNREHVRFWLMSLHKKGNKPGTVHVRYRSLNRFFRWCVVEGERPDNPMDLIDPPKLPDVIQAYYTPEDLQKVLKIIGRRTVNDLRDKGIILTLFDTGVRAAELCGMRQEDLDWRSRTIMVTGKAGKQRRVSIGHVAAQAIERYLRKRGVKSNWLWLAAGRPLTLTGMRAALTRRFQKADVKFQGSHGFRRGFAMSYLESGGQEGDLKELGGWTDYAMVSRYAKANAGERAVNAHKKLSPGDRLKVQ